MSEPVQVYTACRFVGVRDTVCEVSRTPAKHKLKIFHKILFKFFFDILTSFFPDTLTDQHAS